MYKYYSPSSGTEAWVHASAPQTAWFTTGRTEVTPTASDQPFLPSPNYFPSILVTWLPQNAGFGAVDPGQYIIICLRHYRSSGAGSWVWSWKDSPCPGWQWKGKGHPGREAYTPKQYINIPDLLEELVQFVQFQKCDMQLGHPPRKKIYKNLSQTQMFRASDVQIYVFAHMPLGIAFKNGYTVWRKLYVNVGEFLACTPAFWTLPTGLLSFKN